MILGPLRPRICIPINQAGTAFYDTATDIATALAKARLFIDAKGEKRPQDTRNK